jgi:hypothetical protein
MTHNAFYGAPIGIRRGAARMAMKTDANLDYRSPAVAITVI